MLKNAKHERRARNRKSEKIAKTGSIAATMMRANRSGAGPNRLHFLGPGVLLVAMTTTRRFLLSAFAILLPASVAFAADPGGKWTATFETQIGQQNYTYEFKVEGEKITGTAKSNLGSGVITEGKFTGGDTVTFVEMLKFQDMEIRIEYAGKLAGDEIKFTRKVAEVAVEELVAKRAK